jgi:hypothetical protein
MVRVTFACDHGSRWTELYASKTEAFTELVLAAEELEPKLVGTPEDCQEIQLHIQVVQADDLTPDERLALLSGRDDK